MRNQEPEEEKWLPSHTALAETPPRGHRSLLGWLIQGSFLGLRGPLPLPCSCPTGFFQFSEVSSSFPPQSPWIYHSLYLDNFLCHPYLHPGCTCSSFSSYMALLQGHPFLALWIRFFSLMAILVALHLFTINHFLTYLSLPRPMSSKNIGTNVLLFILISPYVWALISNCSGPGT